jgi:hypothetical protein
VNIGGCPLRQRAVRARSLDAGDAHAISVQWTMADEDSHKAKPICHRKLPAPYEGHRILGCAGSALRRPGDHSRNTIAAIGKVLRNDPPD